MPFQSNPTVSQAATNALNIADSVMSRLVNTQADERALIHDLAIAVATLAQASLAVVPATFYAEPGTNTPTTTKSYAQRTK